MTKEFEIAAKEYPGLGEHRIVRCRDGVDTRDTLCLGVGDYWVGISEKIRLRESTVKLTLNRRSIEEKEDGDEFYRLMELREKTFGLRGPREDYIDLVVDQYSLSCSLSHISLTTKTNQFERVHGDYRYPGFELVRYDQFENMETFWNLLFETERERDQAKADFEIQKYKVAKKKCLAIQQVLTEFWKDQAQHLPGLTVIVEKQDLETVCNFLRELEERQVQAYDEPEEVAPELPKTEMVDPWDVEIPKIGEVGFK